MSILNDDFVAEIHPSCLASGDLKSFDGTLKLFAENMTDYAIYMLDPQGRVVTWNLGAERLNGYKQEEVLGQSFSMFFVPDAADAAEPARQLAAALRDGRFETQTWRQRKGGERFWALVTLTAIRGGDGELLGFAKITRDMTAQKALEEAQAKLARDLDDRVSERTRELEASVNEMRGKNNEIESLVAMVSHDLGEKEVLLREVFHRVKNNLQVVQSLLKMGARTLESSDARQAIETAVQRVQVMAMVHEHLYQMPDLSGLTLAAYLREVVEGAIAANAQESNQVQLQIDADEVPVPLDFAIPIGLLANELVTNCLKHGLPRGRRGRISISARKVPGAVRIAVQDDGPGLPADFDVTTSTSIGLKLAASLAHQLGGRLEFTSINGCRVQADLTRLSPKPDSRPPAGRTLPNPPASLLGALKAKATSAKTLSRPYIDPSCYLS
jgi:PAS domain S-box-containing protein